MNRPNSPELTRRAEDMVKTVTRLVVSRPGDRSALRRALRRTPDNIQTQRVHRILARYVRVDADPATERAFYAVASMIAAQPRAARDETGRDTDIEQMPTDPRLPEDEAPTVGEYTAAESLGATLGRAVATGVLNGDTVEARLHLLCRQQLNGIHRHLPSVIVRLHAERVSVGWSRLVADLAGWESRRDQITKQWLQDYYRTLHAIQAAKAKASDTESESENS
ncbi:type I-E CRISPR-associated protein Cse2/CasB [Nocardia sp. 2YAB30]|uniref:type I-E CRISPR-associated protein Cse2/CasB n=1 Tax=unclassified Nocardia TaxID=2637762 RepID=UPI003F9E6FDF